MKRKKSLPLKNINETLQELLAGIFVLGLLFQVTLVWFIKDRLGFSLGLWLGVLAAAFMAVHMWRGLDAALDLGEGGAPNAMKKQSLLRYGAVLVLLGVLMVTEAANPLAAFLGIMTLKAAAYLQPFTHKWMKKLRR